MTLYSDESLISDLNIFKRYSLFGVYELIEDHRRSEENLRYLRDFIHYKNLEDEFRYFKENAHEEYEPDLPFSYLTL